LVVGAPVAAQEPLTIEPVRAGLWMIGGSGGNVAVRATPDGVLLVDTGLRSRYAELVSLVATVTPQPIRWVVTTHMHPDHAGGNAELAGDVDVVGGLATRDLMRRNDMPGEPRTLVDDATPLSLGGVEVRVLPLAGHTGGDVVVHFPDLRVVHAGDLLHEVAPFIDYGQGGGSAAWMAALDALLALDFDVAIVGHGALMERDDVVAFRTQMQTVRARMRDMIERGALRRDVGPGIVSADLTWTQYRSSGLFRSLSGLYDEVLREMMAGGFTPRPGQYQGR